MELGPGVFELGAKTALYAKPFECLGVVDLETKILTVPTMNVNDELQVRQAFGWRLAQASARSFATGGQMVGGGVEVGGGLVVGGGQMVMNNAHYTDLVLHRPPSPRVLQLADLERKYDAVQFRPDVAHSVTALVGFVLFGVAVYSWLGLTELFGIAFSGWNIFGPVLLGAAGGLLVRQALQKRRVQSNLQAERHQLQLIEAARRAGAMKVTA